MELNTNAKVGIVGLGLMGTSIATALLINGEKVIALAPVLSSTEQTAPERIRHALEECYREGLCTVPVKNLVQNITFTSDYTELKSCWLVMECVLEDLKVKLDVYEKIESGVPDEVIIATNTSAMPISMLQNYLRVPERFFGLHWAEPAYSSQFLEIICGAKSPLEVGEQLYAITKKWGKEPTLVRKDIRGFITNRIMYAMYREAFHLVENGYATIEDVDRACKNDGGHWMTFCGLFRYMDLTGLQAYHSVIKDLFPELSNQNTVPKLIDDIAKEGGNGIFNGKGFYEYTPEEAKAWESTFEKFKFDIHRLSLSYTDKLKDISSVNSK